MDRIHDLVHCYPGDLCQYNSIRVNANIHLFPQSVDLYDREIFYDTMEPAEYSEDDPHFFHSVSTITDLGREDDVDDTSSHFFATFPSFSALSLASVDVNLYDCPCLEGDSSLFTYWMDLQIFNSTTYLDYYPSSDT